MFFEYSVHFLRLDIPALCYQPDSALLFLYYVTAIILDELKMFVNEKIAV